MTRAGGNIVNDSEKSREQLLRELADLRKRLAEPSKEEIALLLRSSHARPTQARGAMRGTGRHEGDSLLALIARVAEARAARAMAIATESRDRGRNG